MKSARDKDVGLRAVHKKTERSSLNVDRPLFGDTDERASGMKMGSSCDIGVTYTIASAGTKSGKTVTLIIATNVFQTAITRNICLI